MSKEGVGRARLDFCREHPCSVSQKMPTGSLSEAKRLRQLLLDSLEETMPRRGLTAVHQRRMHTHRAASFQQRCVTGKDPTGTELRL